MTGTESGRAGAPLSVRIRGLLRGTELNGQGSIELTEHDLTIMLHHRAPSVPGRGAFLEYGAIEGASWRDGALTLFLANGDAIELDEAPELGDLARAIADRVCRIPELTRPMRTLGSRRSGAHIGEGHDQFFAPLLAARRRAEESTDLTKRLAAFDPASLRDAIEATLREFAEERFPDRPPDRRALEAQLLDLAEGLFADLDNVQNATDRVRRSGDDTRFIAWRQWAAAVSEVFEEADHCWLVAGPVLAAPTGRQSGFWRRVLRLSALLVWPMASAAAQHVALRIVGVPAETLLARDFDVVEAGARDGRRYAIVIADSLDRGRLAASGWDVSVLQTPGSRTRAGLRAAPTIARVYRSFDDPARGVRFFLDSLARNNPLVHLDTLGFSAQGRPILAAKIGAVGDAPDRPNVLYMATYHAREWAATEMALRLIRYLTQTPSANARADSLVKTRDIWIVPVENPDGYEYTFTTDRLWRKNRRPVGTGAFGVDLNRNHSNHWAFDNQGSSPSPFSETYRGPSAASELETQAVERFHALHPPIASISYHTYTGLVLYPPGYQYGLLPGDLGVFRALAGTDERPSVRDHLPASIRDRAHPAPSWNLYTTNGEYNDWAYDRYGTISFTPELSSGYEGGAYYGFEFPDDEQKLQTLFTDNLPFALDVLESARQPLGYRSPTTGLSSGPIELESVSPQVRVRVAGSTATIAAPAALSYTVDTTAGRRQGGAYTRRLISRSVFRPARVTVTAAGVSAPFILLAANGAEVDDEPWTARGFTTATGGVVGSFSWTGSGSATLRSPSIAVPAGIDTLSILYWSQNFGDGFSPEPHGELRVSRDGGVSFQIVESVRGYAPVFYTESALISGVAGQTIVIEFVCAGLRWDLDEITVVGHGASNLVSTTRLTVRPSENPVSSGIVHFGWPSTPDAGELLLYDFAGRLAWRTDVTPFTQDVLWDVDASGLRNGVYLLVARAGGAIFRQKLYLTRAR